MLRDTNLKVTFETYIETRNKVSKAFFFYILSLKVDLEVNLFIILKTTFKLTQERISRIVFSKVDLAKSDNFYK